MRIRARRITVEKPTKRGCTILLLVAMALLAGVIVSGVLAGLSIRGAALCSDRGSYRRLRLCGKAGAECHR
jgi:hypothetical protein